MLLILKFQAGTEQKRKFIFFDEASWNDCVKLNIENFELDKVPSQEIVNKVRIITKGISNKEDKVNAVLNYVQEEIHYLDYDLIEPKKPETVLKQEFGDCKSKSLLVIKMLECLGVKSWPLLVKSVGLDERLLNVYSGQAFDHCVVEYLYEGESLIFDPTLVPQKGKIWEKSVSDFRYGLRVIKDERQLTKLSWKSDEIFDVVALISKEKERARSCSISWEIEFKGQLANRQNYIYKKQGVKSVFETVSDELLYNSFLSSKNCSIKYSFEEKKPKSTLKIKSNKSIKIFDEGEFIPYPLYAKLKIPEREELSKVFELPKVIKTNQLYKIQKLRWIDYKADSTNFQNDWLKYQRESWIKNDTVYLSFKTELLKSHLDSIRYKDVEETIDFLKNDMTILLSKKAVPYDDIVIDSTPKIKNYLPTIIIFILIVFVGLMALKRKKN